MLQRHRISTNIGKDQKITVELKQDFDVLEILSLKFTQQQIYTSMCSDYGVVCGRVTANNGFGVGNAKVSIFVPLSVDDENDPVISSLYPYKEISDKNENGYRYNLLPSRKQHGGHNPTGTFPDQSDILEREEYLEVFEKYYKYTVKTNSAGDFMIWGVPVGLQTIHVDVDLSDIGCFSLRPADFQRLGVGLDQFENNYTFKSSQDLDSLPQIISFDRNVEVYPFWGNEELCEIGITRTDFDLSERGVNIQPKAYVIGGVYTDNGKNAINKNCTPRAKMGRKCDLVTKSGKIEAIRFMSIKDEENRPYLEYIQLDEDIPEDGGFILPLEMNMDYVITNEFGENEITNDPNRGIPTSACYRLRISLNDSGLDRTRMNADFLVPNVREYGTDGLTWTIDDKSYYFGTEWSGYPTNAVSVNSTYGILYNEGGQFYPKDYFYRFTYNKVYTVSSLQSSYVKTNSSGKNKYLGIKELVPTEEEDCSENLTPPVNFGTKNYTFALLIADIGLAFENIFNIVFLLLMNVLAKLFLSLGDAFINLSFLGIRPLGGLGRTLQVIGYTIMDKGQKGLELIAYPECEKCGESETGITSGADSDAKNCVVGEVEYSTYDFPTIGLTAVITGQTFIPSGGSEGYLIPITPLTGSCTGSTVFIDTDDFIATQSDYAIKTESGLFPLSPVGTTNSLYVDYFSGSTFLIFYDPSNTLVVEADSRYTYDIVSLTYGEDGPITGSTVTLEEGCELYDTPYNEDLISLYYTATGTTEGARGGTPTYTPGMNVFGTNLADTDGYALPSSYNGSVFDKTTISGKSEFANGIFYVVPGSQSNSRLLGIILEFFRRKRVGTLFCGGIVNYGFIDNWLSGSLYFFQFKAKKVNTNEENRLKYCRTLVRYVESQRRFYYRSAFFNGTSFTRIANIIGFPTTFVDLGPRDEFIKEICLDKQLDPSCSVARSIGPTSFKNFGELLGLAINYRMDVSDAKMNINEFFDNGGSFIGKGFEDVLDGDIMQLISINNEAGIEEFDLQNPKYLGYSYQFLDPDDPTSSKVFTTTGTTYGPLPITLFLDENGYETRLCLNQRLKESSQIVPFYLWDKGSTGFGPNNETTLDDQSWYYSNIQSQPLQNMTYGYSYTSSPNNTSDQYLLLPITYTFSGHTGNTGNITDDFMFDAIIPNTQSHTQFDTKYPGFTVLVSSNSEIDNPTSGTLYTRVGPVSGNSSYQGISIINGWYQQPWNTSVDFIIRPTYDYYSSRYQILSTPFQFYFGLKAGKTGLDKFIDQYGPKGAFTSAE